jgi:hypothetical protein
MKKIILGLLILLIGLIVGVTFFYTKKEPPVVQEPVQREEKATYINASPDNIVVELPFPGAVTGKEFSVIGKARGPWYFEASFPVEVLDSQGKRLAMGIAQAEGDWMTTEFVPFTAVIKIPETYIGKATLILRKDNPSGLPEHDASMSFPFTIEY